MKKNIAFLLLAILTLNSFAQKPLYKRKHQLNKTLHEVMDFDGFKTAGFAFYAIDLNTGETIAQLNPDRVLKPASTLKLLTTASTLELLGPDYQFETRLDYTGEIDIINHFLAGDIIIKGGGDPTLGSGYFESTNNKQFLNEWIEAIKRLGIDSISGRIIADARAFSWDIVPPSWSWQNMGNYYGAGPCGLSVYDNYYTVLFNTGEQAGDSTELVAVSPETTELKFDNAVTSDSISFDNAYIYGAPYSKRRYIRGELPLSKENFGVKGSMPDPALVAAVELDVALKGIEIASTKSATTIRRLQMQNKVISGQRTKLFTTYSPPLSEIIAQTNIHSINLFAEHCLIAAGIELGAAAETVIAIDSVVSFWKTKGMDTRGISMNDGSGLSQYNVISPRQMVFVLQFMKNNSPYFDSFYNSVPIAGETGSLENMFKGSIAEGKLRAKSGTIEGVKAYSGYVTSKSGREIAFSMVVNNFSCTSQEARDKLEQLMIALAEFEK